MQLGLIMRETVSSLGKGVAEEFENLGIKINAGWLTEHTEDDGHADVTAWSLTLSKDEETGHTGDLDADGHGHFGGTGAFGDEVTITGLDVTGSVEGTIEIGLQVSGGSGTGAVGAGIHLPSLSGDQAWAMIVSDDSFNASLGWFDVTGAREVLKLYRVGAASYLLSPSEDGLSTVKLGDRTDADLTFDECAAFDLFASHLNLGDGVAAPAAIAGRARIYVDTADGDLKVKFGDGTVKVIATNP
jgi:hypothetical protein